MKNIFLSGRRCAGLAFGVVGFFGIHFGHARAATINANSPSFADVSAAVASASDGDTVIIPAGTATWTSTLTITKGIALIGQTTTNSVAGTASDNTIITENISRDGGGNAVLIWITTTLGKTYRISGLTFIDGASTYATNGMIRLCGTSQSVRLDHIHFDDVVHQNWLVNVADWPLYGVIDHNVFDFLTGVGSGAASIEFHSTGYGDESWTEPAYYGSEKFVFVEDNYFNNITGNYYGGTSDFFLGGRGVFRHNHSYNVILLGNHGTESGRYRGGRAMEVYNNDFHWTDSTDPGGIRCGSVIVHDNTHDGATMSNAKYFLTAYRKFEKSPSWGGATGDNPWDVNDTEGNGTNVPGHSPFLYDSGTATGGSSATLIDTSKSWTTNQWNLFELRRVSDSQISESVSNTSNTTTNYFFVGYGEQATWTAGDQYQIHKVLIVLDQVGRGAGDLITGDTPINSTTGTAAWPHQALEPSYCWNDVYTPTSTPIVLGATSGSADVIQLNREYYNSAMPGYTPYTYPHPLVSGGGHGPQSPGDLHVMQ